MQDPTPLKQARLDESALLSKVYDLAAVEYEMRKAIFSRSGQETWELAGKARDTMSEMLVMIYGDDGMPSEPEQAFIALMNMLGE